MPLKEGEGKKREREMGWYRGLVDEGGKAVSVIDRERREEGRERERGSSSRRGEAPTESQTTGGIL